MRSLSLSDGLKEQNGSRDRDIERVQATQHRDADMGIGSTPPLVGKSRRFRTHDDGRSLRHRGVIVEARVLQLGGEDLYAARFQEADARF